MPLTPRPPSAPEEMNDAELVEALAAFMGWEKITPEDKYGDVWMDGDDGMYRVCDWNPITDMADALQVLVRMGPCWQVSLSDPGGWPDDQRWWCWLPKENGGDGTITMQPTPQRAICIAALLAIRSLQPHD